MLSDSEPTVDDQADFRVHVVTESIRLFAENSYESTTVDQIAAAAGISRRTFFRQFGSKEDVIFADHEALFARVANHLVTVGGAPWSAPCSAAEIVFTHFSRTRELAVRRFRVVQEVPALRDRELVTTYRYQRMFEEDLRRRLPDESAAHLAGYAAAVTGAHNYLLRAMIRGDRTATIGRLRRELDRIRLALGADGSSDRRRVAVVTFDAGATSEEVAREVGEHLRSEDGSRRQ
ncbi:putative TetR family transcriptional regulator [Gordonia effusa NBRC 100432]|uniref:Putative TetR family transcriptional regulator n=1 Tax=Gordonia effusa NBRC 100432 TaxID=1077974 RepID=H0R6N3_9ACTN|nr:TetR family transcriptional regulator [Gordonia effusa]GAB20734.1 putative TetR family transcriptional regulator [Gordonia effusa NBRC 100432]